MKHALVAVSAGIFLTVTVLTGCYEPTAFTWYEAGVYKGAPDPLLEALGREDLQRTLEQRLTAVQTDR